MSTLLDHSLTIGASEVTYGVPVTPSRSYEWLESSKIDQDPGTIQGAGLRQGSKFPRADRSVPGISRVTGSVNMELLSKGCGLLLEQAFGTATSTQVSGALYQQVFTATTSGTIMPPFTAQEGIVRTDGTIEAFTASGCTVKSLALDQKAGAPLECKFDIDGRRKHRWRQVTDGVTTSASTTLTSASGAFGWGDVGVPISGTNISASTTIASVESATSATLSAAATGSGTGLTISIGTAYVTPTYPASPSLYTGALPTSGALTIGGTLTAPTTTALASVAGGTVAVGLQSWSLQIDNGLDTKRDYVGGRGNPTTGGRKGTITAIIEYDVTTGPTLADAQANGTKLAWLIGSRTAEAITAGQPAQMQLAMASVRIDTGAFPQPTKGDAATTTVKATIMDGLVAAQAVYMVLRTADTAL